MTKPGLVALVLILAGCGTSSGTPTTSPSEEPDRLIGQLRDAGLAVESAGSFTTDPLGGTGELLCVGTEQVRLYLFGSEAAASAASARIDPDDPSNLGNVIVEWAGKPRFWQRGPMLVLYLGDDQATEDSLTQALGAPFARGAVPGRGLPGGPDPCAEG